MPENRCINCGDPNAHPYELMIRSTRHEEVFLCETCHEAIQEEMADSA